MSICSQDFQFFDPALAQLQEREMAVHKVRTLAHTSHNLAAYRLVATKWDWGHVEGDSRTGRYP